ncbi:hypothetical protein AMTR_s00070p00176680 [Amborella trichopoda]|uniref:Aminotransferase-like plant mobile domain-containing protein n=1 Tax=Amborella trichopoda TaxID=13333 RepID=U5DGQ1_AMBTC|nr:hypothetical protein AMTR_s00070p00176680 [Amborella trichopoda]
MQKRWHSDTNSFHYNIQIGEMTPTLFDVYEILGLVVDGDPVTCRPISDLREFIDINLGIVPIGGNLAIIKHSWLKANFHTLLPDLTHVQVLRYTRAYMLFLISVTIFAYSSVATMPTRYLQFFEDIEEAGKYAWGAVALAYLYLFPWKNLYFQANTF